jgi:hypothetical protein
MAVARMEIGGLIQGKPMEAMNKTAVSTLLTAAFAVGPAAVSGLQAPVDDPQELVQPADSLEARVWLDRGEEPVVQRGDEVRVYYRTSDDAFAAIFRIDTDGEISLVFPQHPDVDPYVGGGRDYRLLFPDSPRWEVREDPGMGYFFMIASPLPLDFSAFGWDVDEGWDLSNVARTVYEDPYVAIDDYVAAILPGWETTPYALDFLEYSVGEAHEYPRFLCYDCHGFEGYSTWNPYADACTSYSVVVWHDPYFLPRYRYVGTRVVFARPFGPRPRYTVTTRVVGRPWGPIVRTRPAPPRRIVAYKEPARSTPLRRPSAVVPGRSPSTIRGAPSARGPRAVAPTRPAPSRAAPARVAPGRGAPSRVAPDRGAPTRMTPGRGAPTPRVTPGRAAPSRAMPDRARPSRAPGRALPSRALPDRVRSSPPDAGGDRGRPALQRRDPSGRMGLPSTGSASPSRQRPVIRTSPRGAPTGPSRPRAAPSRGPAPPAARPGGTPSARPGPGARPSRPPPRARPGGTGSATGRAAPAPRPRPGGAARPPPRVRSGGPGGAATRPSAGRPPPRSGGVGARSSGPRGPVGAPSRGGRRSGNSGRAPGASGA